MFNISLYVEISILTHSTISSSLPLGILSFDNNEFMNCFVIDGNGSAKKRFLPQQDMIF